MFIVIARLLPRGEGYSRALPPTILKAAFFEICLWPWSARSVSRLLRL